MENFSYGRATDLQSALMALREPSTRALAGGTELLNWMRDGIDAPSRVVDIGRLPLDTIDITESGLRLGALARMSEVAAHPGVRRGFPVLVQSLELAGRTIRKTRIALGGLAHKPWRLAPAERALEGTRLEHGAIAAAVHGAFDEARPLEQNGFKIQLAKNAVVRALEYAGGLK